MEKKNRKRKYPFPQPDEKKNRELRDLRITDRPKVIETIPEGYSTVGQYNRAVSNRARQSFKDTEKLREQVDFIENLDKTKEVTEAKIKGQVRRLTDKHLKDWSPQEIGSFEELSPKLQKYILEQQEKKNR